MRDAFDESFDELIEKGFIQEAGIGPDGEPQYRLTGKADDYLNKLELLQALEKNSPAEILKRMTSP